MTKIITIHSFRRGAGKSTTAANVSAVLAARGRRVGLFDADLQSPSLLSLFGVAEAAVPSSLNDYLAGKCDIEQATYDVTPYLNADVAGRIFLVPASPDPHQIAQSLRSNHDLKLLDDAFQTLAAALQLDILIVDTHAGLHEDSLLAMALSDMLLIMLRYDQQDYHGTRLSLDIAQHLNLPTIALVVNEVLEQSDTGLVQTQIAQAFDCPVISVIPYSEDVIALSDTPFFVLHHPHHRLTNAFKRLAGAVVATH